MPRRAAVPELDREPDAATTAEGAAPKAPLPAERAPARYLWAARIARIYATGPLLCPCGGAMRLIAFTTEREPVDRILKAIGEPTRPPQVAPARGPPPPPDSVAAPLPVWDELAQPTPEFQFDQTLSW